MAYDKNQNQYFIIRAKLDQQTMDKLKFCAEQLGLSQNETCNRAIDVFIAYLKSQDDDV